MSPLLLRTISTRTWRSLFSAAILVALAACEGPVGPQGPAGPQGPQGAVGPQGPAGASMAYNIFEGPITATTMSTALVSTGGVAPGIVCYISHTSYPGVWVQLNTDTYAGYACGVVQQGAGYYGRAVVTSDYVNAGWSIRIILFWLPAGAGV